MSRNVDLRPTPQGEAETGVNVGEMSRILASDKRKQCQVSVYYSPRESKKATLAAAFVICILFYYHLEGTWKVPGVSFRLCLLVL